MSAMLAGAELEDLLKAPLTYPEVGHTQGRMPSGYHHLSRHAVVGAGRARFEEVARTLLGWEMHRRAGLSVRPSNAQAVEGCVAVLRLGIGVVAVNAPVRVVHVVNQSHRLGFAYGTLQGHPESGEESFVVELHDGGEVSLTVTAFSRPSSRTARAGGPVTRAAQTWVTNRYLRSFQA